MKVSEVSRKQVNYMVACIHEFANRNRISQQAAYEYLRKYQGIVFLTEHYEIEHTLSMQDALDDLAMICRQNGGELS